jgi:hypothetical protein
MSLGCLFGLVVFRLSHGKLAKGGLPSSNGNESMEMTRALRRVRAMIVALPFLLVVGLWITRDQPFLPRLVGAVINVFITCWLLTLLSRRARRKVR